MKLSEAFLIYGSDKTTVHSYGDFYDDLEIAITEACWDHERSEWDAHPQVLEIGLCNAGATTCPSLQAWEQCLNANVWGIDIDEESVNRARAIPNARGLVADQSKREDLERVQRAVGNSALDLIVDDGSHKPDDQLLAAEVLFACLKPGGWYVIEDLQNRDDAKRFTHLPGFRLIDFRDVKGRYDDILVVMRKPL